MSCLSQDFLAQAVMELVSLTKEEKRHLIQCDQCRAIFLLLAESQEDPAVCLSTAGKQQRKVARKSSLILLPYRPSQDSQPRRQRLAALGSKPAQPYQVQTFASAAGDIVGRLLRETKNGRSRLYLIAENPARISGVKVWLEGMDIEGVTDEFGSLELGMHDELQVQKIHIY